MSLGSTAHSRRMPASPASHDVFSAGGDRPASSSTQSPGHHAGSNDRHVEQGVREAYEDSPAKFDSVASRRTDRSFANSDYSSTHHTAKPLGYSIHPRLRGASTNMYPKERTNSARQSFSSGMHPRNPTLRRISKAGSLISNGRRFSSAHRGLMSPGGGDRDETRTLGGESKVALPALVPGIRPAYQTPLPLLPMIVLTVVSQ